MGKLLVLLAVLCTLEAAAGNKDASPPCPGLPAANGMDIKCMNPKDNSTVECVSSSTVPRGTVAHYKCQKDDDNGGFEQATLSCICKGRWKGIPKFNEVAVGCGGTTLDAALGISKTQMPTIPENSNAGEANVDGLNLSTEGGETNSVGPTQGSPQMSVSVNGTATPETALVMPLLPASAAASENSSLTSSTPSSSDQQRNGKSLELSGNDEPGPLYVSIHDLVLDAANSDDSKTGRTTTPTPTTQQAPKNDSQQRNEKSLDLSAANVNPQNATLTDEPGVLHVAVKELNSDSNQNSSTPSPSSNGTLAVVCNCTSTATSSTPSSVDGGVGTSTANSTSGASSSDSTTPTSTSAPGESSPSPNSDSSTSTSITTDEASATSTPNVLSTSTSIPQPSIATEGPGQKPEPVVVEVERQPKELGNSTETPANSQTGQTDMPLQSSTEVSPSSGSGVKLINDTESTTKNPTEVSANNSTETSSPGNPSVSSGAPTGSADLLGSTSSSTESSLGATSGSADSSGGASSSTEASSGATDSSGTASSPSDTSSASSEAPSGSTDSSSGVVSSSTEVPSGVPSGLLDSSGTASSSTESSSGAASGSTASSGSSSSSTESSSGATSGSAESSGAASSSTEASSDVPSGSTDSSGTASSPSDTSSASSEAAPSGLSDSSGTASSSTEASTGTLSGSTDSSASASSSTEGSSGAPSGSTDSSGAVSSSTDAPSGSPGTASSSTETTFNASETSTSPTATPSSLSETPQNATGTAEISANPASANTTETPSSLSSTEGSAGSGGDVRQISSSTAEPSSSNETSTESSSSSAMSSMPTEATPSNASTDMSASLPDGTGNVNDYQMKSLELHNQLRKEHRSQPLKLNDTLNKMAMECAENAVSAQKLSVTPGKRKYAENIYRVSGGSPLTDVEAVELAFASWSRSEKYFNYEHPKPTAFSQMVWNQTTQLGTGVAKLGPKTAVCATYYKRGNVILVNGAPNSDTGYFFKKNVFSSDNAVQSTTPSISVSTEIEHDINTSTASTILSSSPSAK